MERRSKKPIVFESVHLSKLVHGGQCLAEAPDGRKMFVWGGLPNEVVDVKVTRKKSSYYEAVVTNVVQLSEHRVEPRELEHYLSSSPWQIMTPEYETTAKQSILDEAFTRESVKGINWKPFYDAPSHYSYRNKMEYGFWGDDDGLHYAQYIRGTHGKRILTSSALALPVINEVAESLLLVLGKWVRKHNVRAGDLKTVVFRANREGQVVAALFTKKDDVAFDLDLPEQLKGIVLYHSNPKSPASVPTKRLDIIGDITLTDRILGENIMYDVLSFFQINVPVFEQVLKTIKKSARAEKFTKVVDFYAGVGTIGVPLHADTLVESDPINIGYARQNAKNRHTELVQATSETALNHIPASKTLIVDPPRAGLHKDVVDKIKERGTPQVVYLSCNPSTQARDIALLQDDYQIDYARGYNFFPRTPHIESLIVLRKR